MIRKITLIAALMLLGLGILVASAQSVAGTATANLDVSATVDSSCTISTSAVTFPDYQPIGANKESPDDSSGGAVIVTCTVGVNPVVGLSLGAHAAGSQARMLHSFSDYLPYGLFQNASRTVAWGPSPPDTVALGPATDTDPRTVAVYGRIPAGLSPAAGTYYDTVVATLNF